MKMCVAAVLTMAMVLGSIACSAGCSGSPHTETTPSDMAKSSSDAESSDDGADGSADPSSDPDAQHSDSYTDPVTDTSPDDTDPPIDEPDPDWRPEPMETITIDPSLSILNLKSRVSVYQYGLLDETDGLVMRENFRIERIDFWDDTKIPLCEKLTEIFYGREQELVEKYNTALSRLLSDHAAGKALCDAAGSSDVMVFRADDKILSFSLLYGWYEEIEPESYDSDSREDFYTLHADSGEAVTLEEIVADKEGLCECVRAYLPLLNYASLPLDELGDLFCEHIMDGTIPFLMTTDGIIIGMEDTNMQLSAINCPGVFNMEYFLTTSDNYVIHSDTSRTIAWDVNGDGRVEQIYIYRNTEGKKIISIGGVENTIESADGSAYDVPDEGYSFYLAKVPSGFLLLCGGYCGSDDRCEVIFRIHDDLTVEYWKTGIMDVIPIVSLFRDYDSFYFSGTYDPTRIILVPVDNAYDWGYFWEMESYTYFDLLGNEVVDEKDVRIEKTPDSVAVSRVDLECRKYSSDGDAVDASGAYIWDTTKNTWEDYTLPAGSSVEVWGYDQIAQELLIQVLFEQNDNTVLVRIPYANHHFENGMEGPEAFAGLSYGG